MLAHAYRLVQTPAVTVPPGPDQSSGNRVPSLAKLTARSVTLGPEQSHPFTLAWWRAVPRPVVAHQNLLATGERMYIWSQVRKCKLTSSLHLPYSANLPDAEGTKRKGLILQLKRRIRELDQKSLNSKLFVHRTLSCQRRKCLANRTHSLQDIDRPAENAGNTECFCLFGVLIFVTEMTKFGNGVCFC